jgi:recombination protein U
MVLMINYRNRGKSFESQIDYTNRQYRLKGWALVDQVPTPAKNIKGRIIYEKKSTVDFIGIAHGRGLAFDAKSTKQTTRFDLKNIHEHQMDYLIQYQDQGGLAFVLIHFEKKRETFYVPVDFIKPYWEAWGSGGRASIPYKDLFFGCPLVHSEKGIALHYLRHCS